MLFPAKKNAGAQKDNAISRQEKVAFSSPLWVSWDSFPLPLPQSVQGGRAYATTKISRIDR